MDAPTHPTVQGTHKPTSEPMHETDRTYLDAGARREVADRGGGRLAEDGEEGHGPEGAVGELAQVGEGLLWGAHLLCFAVCVGGWLVGRVTDGRSKWEGELGGPLVF